MACLSALQLAVHLSQRLSGWEDGLSLNDALALDRLIHREEHTPAPDDIVAVTGVCAPYLPRTKMTEVERDIVWSQSL